MKYCSFSHEGRVRYGFELEPGILVDLPETLVALLRDGAIPASAESFARIPDLRSWLAAGTPAWEVAEQVRRNLQEREPAARPGVISLKRCRLVAPLRPGKIIGVGLNYRKHAEEQGAPLPARPVLFSKFPTAVIGIDEPIKIPPSSQKVDPEAELCAVMLAGGRYFSREKAVESAAFTIGNDVTARDMQHSDRQWVRGKSCDTFAPLGPYVVTRDEIGDPHNLNIHLRVNDELRQSASTSDLIFDSYALIEFISETITLEPGDVIFTGTPSGVGVFRDPPVFLQPGDLVEVGIEKLGVLTNPVVAG